MKRVPKYHNSSLLIGGLLLAVGSFGATAAEQTGFSDGSIKMDFRYRFENVEQDGFDENATASLLRSRFTLTSGVSNGFSAGLEVDNVTELGIDDYNSTENGQSEYPVIADPTGTGVNQAWLKYSTDSFKATLGRQRILHGDQRFLGGVAWRQNEQTYDGLRLEWKLETGLNLDFAYIDNVSRIFGPDDGANPSDLDGSNYVLRIDYPVASNHKLSAYGYWLDFDAQRGFGAGKAINNSSDTVGFEYSGKFDQFSITAAWATQSDGGDSALDYDANRYLVEFAKKIGPVSVKFGREVLSADNGVGFKTPLATLHKFQGWTDKFLGTPGDGMEDSYLGVSGAVDKTKWMVVYHDFEAEDSATDFGSELDFVWTWPVSKQMTVQAKYASFNSKARSRYADTDKAWVTLQYKI
jgi:hypothetical protein